MAKHKKIDETTPLLQVLQGLKDKSIFPEDVSKEMISLIVGYLGLEGWTQPQISQLLGFYDKKVQRAHDDFEDMLQVTTSLEFVRRRIGYFIAAADNQIGALLRIARSVNSPNIEKIAAENSVWKIRVDVVSKLQSLGCLPTQPQQINADLFHHTAGGDGDEIIEAKSVLVAIEDATRKAGTFDAKTESQIKALKARIESAELNQEATQLLENLKKAQTEQEDKNEQENTK